LGLVPSAHALQQVGYQRHQHESEENKDLDKRDVLHGGFYLLCPPEGSPPVSAIASRIALSACTFFIR
jgi:hypothetical protein